MVDPRAVEAALKTRFDSPVRGIWAMLAPESYRGKSYRVKWIVIIVAVGLLALASSEPALCDCFR